MTRQPLHVLMISSEVESLARTGGLGDVVAALSRELATLGAHVLVVTPLYAVTSMPAASHRWPGSVEVRWGSGHTDVRRVEVVELAEQKFASGGTLRICLVDEPGLYGRGGIYGDGSGPFVDNALRFAVLSRASLEIAARVHEGGPDVIHAHDWHASFAVVYAKLVMGARWAGKKAVFTIHNLAFQGSFEHREVEGLHLPDEAFKPELLLHDGRINAMKAAIALSDRTTTVSPTYSKEIRTPAGGFGLDAHLRAHEARLVGILNGIDVKAFDPASDDALSERYDASSSAVGRAKCKAALAKELGLSDGDGPIFGIVTRLSWQKGIDLVLPLFDEMVAKGGRIVAVGQGDGDLEAKLKAASSRHGGRVAARIAFDPELSRRVYSGVDFFLLPSRFEPCGLTQMYAMRYGAIPIVSDVGGLHDTVVPLTGDAGTGIVVRPPSVDAFEAACVRAFELYADETQLRRVQARGMAQDFSWTESARRYADLFEALHTSP